MRARRRQGGLRGDYDPGGGCDIAIAILGILVVMTISNLEEINGTAGWKRKRATISRPDGHPQNEQCGGMALVLRADYPRPGYGYRWPDASPGTGRDRPARLTTP